MHDAAVGNIIELIKVGVTIITPVNPFVSDSELYLCWIHLSLNDVKDGDVFSLASFLGTSVR
jgi:hypothetical protein